MLYERGKDAHLFARVLWAALRHSLRGPTCSFGGVSTGVVRCNLPILLPLIMREERMRRATPP